MDAELETMPARNDVLMRMPTRLLVAYLVFSTLLVATTLLSGFMAGGRLLLAAGALAVRRG